MHIQFHKVRYKNILSVGNQFIEIDLEGGRTTIISGSNGAGKSTLIESIVFALFGKPLRKINKPQLINSVNNKELLVELEFTIASKKYLIRRGMKPAVFEIYENDVLVDKDAASKDYQEQLEQSIIKMSYKAFTQIVILGSATYVPFMDLTTGQRREIIEDLLDIQVFSVMNQLLKEHVSENKEEVAGVNHSIDLVKSKVSSAKEHNNELQKLKKVEVDKLKSKIKVLIEDYGSCKEDIKELERKREDLIESVSDKQKNLTSRDKMNSLLQDLNTKIKSVRSEIEFYKEHDNCPTCKQSILEEFKTNTIKEKFEKEKELEDAIKNLQDRLYTISLRLDEIVEVETLLQSFTNSKNEKILSNKIIMNQLKAIQEELESAEKEAEEVDQTKITALITELQAFEKNQTSLHDHREILAAVGSMLKDGGIKTSIIKTYVPIMNKIINQYLSEFELFVDFNLNEDFTETIKSRFRDAFSFGSFSEGEKMRISLSIMFAWRALAKLRNSASTNLLILDEILDSASDAAGVESLLEILKKLNANDNILVISHRGHDFEEKFDRHLQFQKIKNFTELVG